MPVHICGERDRYDSSRCVDVLVAACAFWGVCSDDESNHHR